MRLKARRTRGFTLIELLVVVVIIGILAGLLFPLLSKAQRKAQSRSCLTKMKSFASAIRIYAATWEGFTPPDPETYLTRERGYKAYWENGYFEGDRDRLWYSYQSGSGKDLSESQKFAAKIPDFRCPVDDAPLYNKHGLPKSYMISSTYSGENIANLGAEDNEIVVLAERGKRHIEESGRRYEGHYVYADMHVELGTHWRTKGDLGVVQGLKMKVWYVNDFAEVGPLAESQLPVLISGSPPFRYETVWSSSLRAGDPLWLAVLDGYSYNDDWDLQRSVQAGSFVGGTGNSLVRFPNTFTVRWDGLLKFPKEGKYDFYLEFLAVKEGNAAVEFGLGRPGDVIDATYFQVHQAANDPKSPFSIIVSGADAEQYYPLKLLYRGGQWNGPWKITWTRTDNIMGTVDPEIRSRIVDAKYLFHIP